MSLHTLLAAAEYLEDKNADSKDAAVRCVAISATDDGVGNFGTSRVEPAMAEPRSSPTTDEEKLSFGSFGQGNLVSVQGTVTNTNLHQQPNKGSHLQQSVSERQDLPSMIKYNHQSKEAVDETVREAVNHNPETSLMQEKGNVQIQSTSMPNMDVILARARLAIASSTVASGGHTSVPTKFTNPNQASDLSTLTMPVSGGVLHPSIQDCSAMQQAAMWHGQAPLKPADSRIVLTSNITDPNLNTLLPSLIKTSEDEKVYAALQFKPVKRSMTLTHNQLEKNRRAHLKERFESLKSCIPRLGMRRSSNLTILKAALRHIQVLKKKSIEHEQLMSALQREKCEKFERLGKLKNDLSEKVNGNVIDQYLDSCVEKDFAQEETSSVVSVQTSAMLDDDDQQSTSTASEAEEEEMKASLSFLPRSPNLSRDIVVYPPASTANRHPRRRIVPTTPTAQPTTPPRSAPTNTHVDVRRSEPKRGPEKSPLKLYHAPSGRSATPSPPSNCVSFFPRFAIGSGGSPPLLPSKESIFAQKPVESMVFAGQKNFGQKQENGAVLNPVYKGLSRFALPSTTEPAKSIYASLGVPQYVASTQLPVASSGDVTTGLEKQEKTLPSVPVRAGVVLEPDGRVSLPSFSGYQVKVKYVNPTIAVNSSAAPNQAHIPMKKRYHDASSFTVQASVPTKNPRSYMSSMCNSAPKLTSLYVGASATVLGLENSNSGISTSDNESDRDSPMYPEQSRINPKMMHWMKNAVGKEWTQYRSKEVGKKKPVIQVHPYEPAKTSGTAPLAKMTDNRPKATFSLWDRKHHAITMTTATNWRGKQKQLLASQAKTSGVSSVPAPSPVLPAPTSMTQVSYTTLQKPAKPAVPSALVVGRSVASSPQAFAIHTSESRTIPSATIPQLHQKNQPPISSSTAGHQTLDSNGILHTAGHPIPSVQVLPVTGAGNQIAYHIVQTPMVAQGGSQGTPMAAPQVQGHPPVGYVVNAPSEAKDAGVPVDRSAVLTPANMPLMIPVGYVMYPTGMPVGQPGMHLANMPAQPKLVSQPAPNQVNLQMHTGSTRGTPTPVPTDRSRKRVGSADSASSSTVSVDSQEGEKRDQQPKRARMTPSREPGVSTALTNHVLPVDKSPAENAQTQFVVPGNPGFMVANSASAIPINLMGYPLQAYSAGAAGGIHTVQMTGLPSNQPGGFGQILTLPHGMGLQLANMTTTVGAPQPMTSPVTLQVMQAPTQPKDKPPS